MKIKKLLPAVLAALLSLTVIMSPLSIHADEDDPKPTSIRRLNYSKKTLRVGQKFELEAYARPSDYDDDQLIWSTSNKKIVKIEYFSVTGHAKGILIDGSHWETVFGTVVQECLLPDKQRPQR